jgi:predicted DNA-binding ribbon-helix-helix protein
MSGGTLRKHSLLVAGHPTSVTLEDAFWDALKEIARQRGIPVNMLVTEIDRARDGNLSGAIRVFVLDAVRNQNVIGRKQ